RRSTAYSASMGMALGSIIAAIMTVQAPKNAAASARSAPAIGISACVNRASQAAAATTSSSPPVIKPVRSRPRAAPVALPVPPHSSAGDRPRSAPVPHCRRAGPRRPLARRRLPAFRTVEDDPGAEVLAEVFEPVVDAGSDKQRIAWLERHPLVASCKPTPTRG